MLTEAGPDWTIDDADELYDVQRWGEGYFSIGDAGRLAVHPDRDPRRKFDLQRLVERVAEQGVHLPVLLRFNGILRDRITQLQEAFVKAADMVDYQGRYIFVYPIKVNQQRQVVDQIAAHGGQFGFGLEAGSKPELIAVVARSNDDSPIICNGFKDAEFIELAALAQRVGRQVLPVVERYSELRLILEAAERHGVRPTIGFRVKLSSRGAGRWQGSAGSQSKFGLTVAELLQAHEQLASLGMLDCMQLLHFHLGSQITDIRSIKSALIEASRIYCSLYNSGAGLRYLDVGGGLGVDYNGAQTDSDSSMNYTLQEYANDVLFHVESVCRDADVPHPDIVSESGRAVAAYHSALIVPVVGVSGVREEVAEARSLPDDAPEPLRFLDDAYRSVAADTLLESYHDAVQAMDMLMHLFNLGHLTLEDRSYGEQLFWSVCRKISRLRSELEFVPEELRGFDAMLAQTYFCNFSVFQSIPDSWAIKQLFPIMPIHRLQEEPTRHAVLGDITCDSDGKVDRFIDRHETRPTLRLHEFNGEPYLLGVFLTGAYQEILGDLHNLLGDTNELHVDLSPAGEPIVEHVHQGETVSKVLEYVGYRREELLANILAAAEQGVSRGRVGREETAAFLEAYEQGLDGYTYLED